MEADRPARAHPGRDHRQGLEGSAGQHPEGETVICHEATLMNGKADVSPTSTVVWCFVPPGSFKRKARGWRAALRTFTMPGSEHPGARRSARLPAVEQGEQTGDGGRCGLPHSDMLPSHKVGATKLKDPYINELTGLEIPEHDRVTSDFGRPTRDKRVGEVYCLFQTRGEKAPSDLPRRGRRHAPNDAAYGGEHLCRPHAVGDQQ